MADVDGSNMLLREDVAAVTRASRSARLGDTTSCSLPENENKCFQELSLVKYLSFRGPRLESVRYDLGKNFFSAVFNFFCSFKTFYVKNQPKKGLVTLLEGAG